MSFSVVGGQIDFDHMTWDMKNNHPTTYEIEKVQSWLTMMKDNMVPEQWCQPTDKGTSVKFKTLTSLEEAKAEAQRLRAYISQINEVYGVDIQLEGEVKEI